MEIRGWVGEKDSEELRKHREALYEKLKGTNAITIEDIKRGYAQITYRGTVNVPNIQEEEILALCDSGNTCFGGRVSMSSNRFTATVYID